METIKLLVKIIIVFASINFPAHCKVIAREPELDRKINDVNYGQSSEKHLNINTTDTSITPTNATSEITLSGSDINSLTTHIASRTYQGIDLHVEKFRTFLHSASRIFKQLFMYYGHYGPEIGFCTCMAKFAWFEYPIMSQVTYTTLGRARLSVTSFFEDFFHGFIETSSHDNNEHHRISTKVEQTTADDYYDYQNGISNVYGPPSRRVGQSDAEVYADSTKNVQVIEKADPKLVSIVEMLKGLQPKVNQNDSFVIRYARALNMLPIDDESRQTVGKDKIRKYGKKYQHDLNETSVGSINASSINKTRMGAVKGRSMDYEESNNRRVLVPGVPAGLPSYNQLPPADYTYVKNNVVHHVHDLRNGKYRPKRYFDNIMGRNLEELVLGWFGFPAPDKLVGGPTVGSCAKGYAISIVMRHVHMLLFG